MCGTVICYILKILTLTPPLPTSIWLNETDNLDHSANDRCPLVKIYCSKSQKNPLVYSALL